MIPYGRQHISPEDIDAVLQVLQSDFLTQGPQVPAFEASVAAYCDIPHAVAANSATSALHLACLALELGPGDILWTSPITFTASANCALYCGATVDFVDIDPHTLNLSVAALAEKLAQAEISGSLPKIVVPVHLCGEPCDMAAIASLAKRYGFKIIEDASHAIGGHYADAPIGHGIHSDITVFSFHPVKIITSAEGGMALTRNADLAARMRHLRSHGITRNPEDMEGDNEGAWYYQQTALGYNYRMTELQAALGLSQLQRLDEFVARRHVLAARYDRILADLPLILPYRNPAHRSALHLYPVQIRPGHPVGRKQVFDFLRAQGIGVNVHYIPVHTQPYYRRHGGFKSGDFPHAEAYYARALSLPLFYDLSETQQDTVADTLKRALQAA